MSAPDVAAVRSASRPEELRRLARLAAPIALAQAGIALMGLVDTAVVGRIGAAALGGVGLADGIFFTMFTLGMGLLMGIDPLVSQAFGARAPGQARRALWQGIWLTAIITALLTPLMAVAPALLRPDWVRDPEVRRVATVFLWVRIPALLPSLAFMAARSYLQAAHRLAPLVWSTVIANVANAALDLLLVFGGGGFGWLGPLAGWKGWGVYGAAISTDLCAVLQLGILALAVARHPVGSDEPGLHRPHRQTLVHALRVGIPVGLHLFAEVGVFFLAGLLAAYFGPQALAAHQIALKYGSLTFTVAVGVGSAGAVRVGWAVGAQDTPWARRAGFMAFLAGALFMSTSALLFWFAPGALTQLMTDQADVVAIAVPLFFVAAVFQISDGVQGVGAGVLRGAGDSHFTFVANVVGHYLIGLPLALYLAFVRHLGVFGIWWGLCAGLTSVALGLLSRFAWLSARPMRALVGPELQGSTEAQ